MEQQIPISAEKIEKLRAEFETRKTQAAIAQAKVSEIEKQIQDEFGVSIEHVPQKIAELQREADTACAQLQQEYAEFDALWSRITGQPLKVVPSPVVQSASDTDW